MIMAVAVPPAPSPGMAPLEELRRAWLDAAREQEPHLPGLTGRVQRELTALGATRSGEADLMAAVQLFAAMLRDAGRPGEARSLARRMGKAVFEFLLLESVASEQEAQRSPHDDDVPAAGKADGSADDAADAAIEVGPKMELEAVGPAAAGASGALPAVVSAGAPGPRPSIEVAADRHQDPADDGSPAPRPVVPLPRPLHGPSANRYSLFGTELRRPAVPPPPSARGGEAAGTGRGAGQLRGESTDRLAGDRQGAPAPASPGSGGEGARTPTPASTPWPPPAEAVESVLQQTAAANEAEAEPAGTPALELGAEAAPEPAAVAGPVSEPSAIVARHGVAEPVREPVTAPPAVADPDPVGETRPPAAAGAEAAFANSPLTVPVPPGVADPGRAVEPTAAAGAEAPLANGPLAVPVPPAAGEAVTAPVVAEAPDPGRAGEPPAAAGAEAPLANGALAVPVPSGATEPVLFAETEASTFTSGVPARGRPTEAPAAAGAEPPGLAERPRIVEPLGVIGPDDIEPVALPVAGGWAANPAPGGFPAAGPARRPEASVPAPPPGLGSPFAGGPVPSSGAAPAAGPAPAAGVNRPAAPSPGSPADAAGRLVPLRGAGPANPTRPQAPAGPPTGAFPTATQVIPSPPPGGSAARPATADPARFLPPGAPLPPGGTTKAPAPAPPPPAKGRQPEPAQPMASPYLPVSRAPGSGPAGAAGRPSSPLVREMAPAVPARLPTEAGRSETSKAGQPSSPPPPTETVGSGPTAVPRPKVQRADGAVTSAPAAVGSGGAREGKAPPSADAGPGGWGVRISPRVQQVRERRIAGRRADVPTILAQTRSAAAQDLEAALGRGKGRKAARAVRSLPIPDPAEVRRVVDGLFDSRRPWDAAALVGRLAAEAPSAAVGEAACALGERCRDGREADAARMAFLGAVLADPPCERGCWQLAALAFARKDPEDSARWLEFVARLMRARVADQDALAVYRQIAALTPSRKDIQALVRASTLNGSLPD